MAKQFRTVNQFISICKNVENGNWTPAAKQCVEGGFYAKDLLEKYQQHKNSEEINMIALEDIVVLIERSWEIRMQNK